MSSGRFRLDLYFRLGVATIDLPPLRQRLADILPLAERFIEIYSRRLDCEPPILDVEAERALLDYSWPGNIRELENVMHVAVLTCTDGVIRAENLRLAPWAATPHSPVGETQSKAAPAALAVSIDDIGAHIDNLFATRHEQLLENLESLVIHRAMSYCNHNQVQTARLLGISRNVLRTYLKRFGLIGTEAASGVAVDAASNDGTLGSIDTLRLPIRGAARYRTAYAEPRPSEHA